MSVCRSPVTGMRLSSTMRRICGSKPMSSMRSASSSTRKRMLSSPTLPRPIMSSSRPGVATIRWQPRSRSRIWSCVLLPPYSTAGRMRDRSRVGASTSPSGYCLRRFIGRFGGGAAAPCLYIWFRIGTRKAAVLPEPVCAHAIRSRPDRMIGIAYFCTGVGIDVAGHVVARRLHGNIFVLAEIDTGVAVFEQLRLQTLVPLGEHCVVDLATSGSTAAAVSSASGAATAAVAPIGTTRPASATAIRSTIVERSATGGCGTGPFTGAGSAAAADAARSGRAHCRSRLRPAIILRRPVHGSITANGCRSATRTTTSATVRPPVVVPPIASETFRILIAPAVPAALEATAIVVAPVATAAAIVAVVAAAPIVLIAAATAATAATASATPVEVASAIVTIAVAPEVAAATIPVRIAVSTPSATSTTDTAAAYRTNAGTGISRLKVATAISTFSQLRWYVPPGRMLRISGFWVAAATAAAKLLLLLLQVQTSKLHLWE
uniref:Uncharacterized protein n=1 Tax=Anopheles merus TaxID=30066 RepID=A0A182V0B4_ANOME